MKSNGRVFLDLDGNILDHVHGFSYAYDVRWSTDDCTGAVIVDGGYFPPPREILDKVCENIRNKWLKGDGSVSTVPKTYIGVDVAQKIYIDRALVLGEDEVVTVDTVGVDVPMEPRLLDSKTASCGRHYSPTEDLFAAYEEEILDYLRNGLRWKKVQLFIPSPPYAGEEPGTLRRHGGAGDYVNAYIEYPNTWSGRIRK